MTSTSPAGKRASTATKTAVLHRMVLPEHVCPFGVASLELLQSEGFEVEDHRLTTRAETDAFKSELGVSTTPQTFIEGRRIGGYDELKRHLNKHAG